jgi:phospholipid/cholesterol/gamma-HCH transport system substrate-binding protein/paraquat-inducible protein B
MTEETRYRRLGVFVFAALVLLVGVLFLLGGSSLFQSTFTFETYFNDSIAGLEVGSALRLRGVPGTDQRNPALATGMNGMFRRKRRDYIVVRATISQNREWIERIRRQAGDMIKAAFLRAQTQLASITS